MFNVIMQVSKSTNAPFMTKDLDVRISKTDAAALALEKSTGLMQNLDANAKIHRGYFENEFISERNEIADMMYVVFAGNVRVGQFSVVEIA